MNAKYQKIINSISSKDSTIPVHKRQYCIQQISEVFESLIQKQDLDGDEEKSELSHISDSEIVDNVSEQQNCEYGEE